MSGSCQLRFHAILGLARTPGALSHSLTLQHRFVILTRLNNLPLVQTRHSDHAHCPSFLSHDTAFDTHERLRSDVAMDAPEPDTPFSAVTAQTTKYGRVGHPHQTSRIRFALATRWSVHVHSLCDGFLKSAHLLMSRADVPSIS